MSNPDRLVVEPETGDALLVVDLQNDFLPGGSLGVPEAEGLIDAVNRYAEIFERLGLPIVATRDWHPPDHCSFHARGGPWPPHCVADTDGAAFPEALRLPASAAIVHKATESDADAYSGFEGTDLEADLKARGVRRVFLTGIATDYCVKATALDALRAGFDVVLLENGMRAVDAAAGDGARAIEEMHGHGAKSGTVER